MAKSVKGPKQVCLISDKEISLDGKEEVSIINDIEVSLNRKNRSKYDKCRESLY